MKHTFINELDPCDCERNEHIPFLDVSLSLKNGQISTDLYKKPTDKNMYLLPTSAHPLHCTKNIPFSLAMRIVKICSETANRDLRLSELKQMLLDRDYGEQLIDSEIKRALNIPRESALNPNHSSKKENDRPVYVSTFDPRLPNITKSIQKHWQTSCFLDANFKNTFPKPPMVAFKKHRSLRSFLIRAKVSPNHNHRPLRFTKGMYPCMKPCPNCPYIKNIKKVSGPNFTWTLIGKFTCNTKNVIYMIECKKDNCKKRYIGETDRELAERFSDHRGYVKNKHLNQPTGFHFNQPGHDISDMTVMVLEKVKKSDEIYRKQREKYLINKFNTFRNGMNQQP